MPPRPADSAIARAFSWKTRHRGCQGGRLLFGKGAWVPLPASACLAGPPSTCLRSPCRVPRPRAPGSKRQSWPWGWGTGASGALSDHRSQAVQPGRACPHSSSAEPVLPHPEGDRRGQTSCDTVRCHSHLGDHSAALPWGASLGTQKNPWQQDQGVPLPSWGPGQGLAAGAPAVLGRLAGPVTGLVTPWSGVMGSGAWLPGLQHHLHAQAEG